ncbi:MAG TPA: siderophore-interacting protein, partial [Alcanivorax sp.]|nr:siderophore-interacting protein [Alcanivorax sp.]
MPRPAPRILEVLRTESVTPNMKRVVLGGGDLSDFPKNHESANFKLLIPR